MYSYTYIIIVNALARPWNVAAVHPTTMATPICCVCNWRMADSVRSPAYPRSVCIP